ncbi:MAG TPA: hypothetical protein ENK80_01180 [Rhodobacterales bacterium]|nr:hypothetical protein [Rhodobacterales bacterium]
MDTFERSVELAESITGVAREAGLACNALITDMNQPLASAAGNALEVSNAVDFLTGKARDARLEEVTLALAGEMLAITHLAEGRAAGVAKARALLEGGQAADVFARMVAALGGPKDFVDNPEPYLAKAKLTRAVPAPASGDISAIQTREIGLAVVELGGGRRRADDVINPAVGLTELLDLGVEVAAGDPLCVIHADSEAQADAAEAKVLEAYAIGPAPQVSEPVLKIIE